MLLSAGPSGQRAGDRFLAGALTSGAQERQQIAQRQQIEGVVVEDGEEQRPVRGADEVVVELGDDLAAMGSH